MFIDALVQLLAVKDYSPHVFTCIQMNRVERTHSYKDLTKTATIITEDLMLSMIATSCIARGFSTLLTNLLSIYSIVDVNPSWNLGWRGEYRMYSIRYCNYYFNLYFY